MIALYEYHELPEIIQIGVRGYYEYKARRDNMCKNVEKMLDSYEHQLSNLKEYTPTQWHDLFSNVKVPQPDLMEKFHQWLVRYDYNAENYGVYTISDLKNEAKTFVLIGVSQTDLVRYSAWSCEDIQRLIEMEDVMFDIHGNVYYNPKLIPRRNW